MATWVYKFKQKPDAFQLEVLKRALKLKRYGIFFQQRVGKSQVAINFCGVRHIANGDKKVLILSPLSVRYTWVEQIAYYLPDYIPREVFLTPKSPEKRKELLSAIKEPDKLTFLVMNYDILTNDVNILIKWKPDIVIWDEAHMLGGYKSHRSKAACKIAKTVECVLALTGTPFNKLWQVFGLFRAIDVNIFGSEWKAFRNRYCILGGYMGKQIIGYQRKEEIAAKIAAHSARVLRKEVMKEPEVENILVPVELESNARKHYRKLRDDFITELESGAKFIADTPGARVTRLQQFCGGYLPDADGVMINVTRAKLSATVNLVESVVEGNEKVLVFVRFTPEIDELYRLLSDKGIHTEIFDGRTSEEDRNQIKINFQTKEHPQIILMQIGTGVMGLSFDRAHTNIFYSLDYSLINLYQAKDRVMGRGQKSDVVTNYFMAVKATVDYKIMKILKDNGDIAKFIVDDWRWLMKEEED